MWFPRGQSRLPDFRRVIVRKYVTIRHPIGDRLMDESNGRSGQAITPDSGIACELLKRRVHPERGGVQDSCTQATSTWWRCKKSSSSAWQSRMPLQLNCMNLPLSMVGPGAAVLVWAGELGPMERESPDERVECSFQVGGLRLSGGRCSWDWGGACGSAPRGQPPVVC